MIINTNLTFDSNLYCLLIITLKNIQKSIYVFLLSGLLSYYDKYTYNYNP